MTSFRFLHCSDLHIDSPFKGLSLVQPSLAEKLRNSTYQAFQNIIKLALQEKVEAVLRISTVQPLVWTPEKGCQKLENLKIDISKEDTIVYLQLSRKTSHKKPFRAITMITYR